MPIRYAETDPEFAGVSVTGAAPGMVGVMVTGEEIMVGCGRGSGMVEVPSTTTAVAAGAREMGVPPTVIAGPPGMRVWEPMTKVEPTFSERVAPPGPPTAGRVTGGIIVIAEDGGSADGRGDVEPPMMTAVAEGARDMEVPPTVMPGPPGAMVVPAIEKTDDPATGVRATPG